MGRRYIGHSTATYEPGDLPTATGTLRVGNLADVDSFYIRLLSPLVRLYNWRGAAPYKKEDP